MAMDGLLISHILTSYGYGETGRLVKQTDNLTHNDSKKVIEGYSITQ